MKVLEADKIGSATSPLKLTKTVAVISENDSPGVGDVVVVRALGESVTYGNLELPSGRLAKINMGDILLGVLGKRRALKGFVGDVPDSIKGKVKLTPIMSIVDSHSRGIKQFSPYSAFYWISLAYNP